MRDYKGIPILLAVDFGTVLFGWLVVWSGIGITRWIKGRFSRVTHQTEAHVLKAILDALAEAGYLSHMTEAADVVESGNSQRRRFGNLSRAVIGRS